jgi:endo-alpha-1,4-polygalactosaminidase (GH114 family)
MDISSNYIELALGGVGSLVFYLFFGLITKNEKKSDEADVRLQAEIKEVRQEMKEIVALYRQNDHKLFDSVAVIQSQLSAMDAVISCMKDSK